MEKIDWEEILDIIGSILLIILVIVGIVAFSAGLALGTSWMVMTLLNFIIVHFGFAAFTFWEVAKTYGLVKFIAVFGLILLGLVEPKEN